MFENMTPDPTDIPEDHDCPLCGHMPRVDLDHGDDCLDCRTDGGPCATYSGDVAEVAR